MLIGSSRKRLNETQTPIVVGINRLLAEYNLGKADQMKDEHWRKQLRIMLSFGVTIFSVIAVLFGFDFVPFAGLFIHCIIHVIL